MQLIRDAGRIAAGTQTLIVPSCKFHLPTADESAWKISEYQYTLQRMLAAAHTLSSEGRLSRFAYFASNLE